MVSIETAAIWHCKSLQWRYVNLHANIAKENHWNLETENMFFPALQRIGPMKMSCHCDKMLKRPNLAHLFWCDTENWNWRRHIGKSILQRNPIFLRVSCLPGCWSHHIWLWFFQVFVQLCFDVYPMVFPMVFPKVVWVLISTRRAKPPPKCLPWCQRWKRRPLDWPRRGWWWHLASTWVSVTFGNLGLIGG